VCGDGAVGGIEECDDANTDPGDGCDDTCAVEEGWECTEEPSMCTAADLRVRIISTELTNMDLEVTYEVVNTGGVASGDYRVDLWRGPMGQFDGVPSLGDAGDAMFAGKPSLDPGASAMFMDVIPMTAGGSFVAFAAVDTLGDIVELDENENVGLGHAWTTANLTLFTTFSSDDGPLDITDDAMPVSVGADVMVTSSAPGIRFSVNITHPALDELTLEVLAPNGAAITLVDGDLSGANLGGTTFVGNGAAIAGGAAPYIGEFAPTGMFDMAPTDDGAWQLVVTDNTPGNAGRINYFGVTFSEFDP
jgi:cysteine-rich repeat protein